MELTVTETAKQLGITRTALSRILNGHAGISPGMARRIEAWLGPEHGGSAELWLGMQMDYDLRQAEQKPAPKVERAPVEKMIRSPMPIVFKKAFDMLSI